MCHKSILLHRLVLDIIRKRKRQVQNRCQQILYRFVCHTEPKTSPIDANRLKTNNSGDVLTFPNGFWSLFMAFVIKLKVPSLTN